MTGIQAQQTGVVIRPSRPMWVPAWWFMRVFIKIDGTQKLKRGWGETFVPLAPGQHEVFVSAVGLAGVGWKPGKSTMTVNVSPGQVVHLDYRTPILVWPFLKGKLAIGAAAA